MLLTDKPDQRLGRSWTVKQMEGNLHVTAGRNRAVAMVHNHHSPDGPEGEPQDSDREIATLLATAPDLRRALYAVLDNPDNKIAYEQRQKAERILEAVDQDG